jgi:predicted aspartyl protease
MIYEAATLELIWFPLPLPAPTSAAAKSYLSFKVYRAHDSFLTASLGPLTGPPKGRRMARIAKHLALILLFSCSAAFAFAAPHPEPDTNTHLRVRTIAGYLMIVSVSINDRGPFDFLIDTGTNTTLIDPQLATELALQPKDRLKLASLASATDVPRYYFQTFRVGPASVSNQEALAVPLPQLAALDRKIRGVLGMNFLLQFSFRLDYEHHALELYPFPESAQVPAGLRVPVEINESRLLIKVGSEASPSGSWRLALDSGIAQFLIFQDRIAAAERSCGKANCLMQVATNLADHRASTMLLHDVSIAGARLPETQVVVLHNDLQKPSDRQDGLLPAAPFRSIFFDRTNATVIFSPVSGPFSMASLQQP